MNLPNIPTDNLYKFLAIAGIVLLISANAFFIIFGGRVMDTAQQWLQEGAVNTYEQKIITTKIKSSKNTIIGLEKSIKTAEPSQKQEISKEIRAEQENIMDSQSKLDEVNKKFVTMNNSLNIYWFKMEIEYMKWTLIIGNTLGFLASVFGFYFWYTKLQIYQDKMVKQKVEGNK